MQSNSDEGFVLVSEAARLAAVSKLTVYLWIQLGLVPVQPGCQGTQVSMAAVRALAEAERGRHRRPQAGEIGE